MRLIDADALLTDVGNYCGDYFSHGKDAFDKRAVRFAITAAPTIDTGKHGKWDSKDLINKIWSECSACGTLFDMDLSNAKYCPNCGAKMDSKEDK